MSITKTLFPPANREAAVVAFLRTFWQVVHGVGILGSGGLIVISATQLEHLNVQLVLYTAYGVIASGLLSGAIAAGDILANGLPSAYHAAAVASIPAAQVQTLPVVTPSDPDQPAAGTQPALFVADSAAPVAETPQAIVTAVTAPPV